MIGGKTYALLRNLVAPDLPQDKTLPDMIAALQNHFEPKPLVIAQRFHFHGMEAADRNTKTLHAGTDLATVHKLSKQPTRNPTSVPKQSAHQSCYRCGKSNHDSSSCRFIDATCRNCGKKGHISLRPVCKSTRLLQHRRKPQRTATNYLETEPTTERASSPPEELHMFAFGANSSKLRPIYCDVLVEGTPLTMEVDTGAEVSVISETTCTRKSLFPESKLAKTNVVLTL